jgi:hypothetical protein
MSFLAGLKAGHFLAQIFIPTPKGTLTCNLLGLAYPVTTPGFYDFIIFWCGDLFDKTPSFFYPFSG